MELDVAGQPILNMNLLMVVVNVMTVATYLVLTQLNDNQKRTEQIAGAMDLHVLRKRQVSCRWTNCVECFTDDHMHG
jgi:hypothetical protein